MNTTCVRSLITVSSWTPWPKQSKSNVAKQRAKQRRSPYTVRRRIGDAPLLGWVERGASLPANQPLFEPDSLLRQKRRSKTVKAFSLPVCLLHLRRSPSVLPCPAQGREIEASLLATGHRIRNFI